MKICILTQYPPQLGGIATHSAQLTKELAKKHKITVITYGKFGRKSNKIKIYEVPIINKFFLRGLSYSIGSLKILRKLVKENKIDIIHAQYLFPCGIIAVLFKKFFNKIPVVITTHGSDLLSLVRLPFLNKIFSLVANLSDKLICVSNFLANEAVRIGVKKEKIKVIYNGIDQKNFPTTNKIEIRKELNLPINKKIILFAGALNKQKGADILLREAKEVIEKEKNILFVFVGKGKLKSKLEKFVGKNKLQDYVLFLGSKSHYTTLKYIKGADLLVIPSRIEGFGITALEGMLLQIPIIAFPIGALPELLSKKSLAWDLKNSIVEVLKNRNITEEIIRENEEIIIRFDLKSMVNEIEKLYTNLS